MMFHWRVQEKNLKEKNQKLDTDFHYYQDISCILAV